MNRSTRGSVYCHRCGCEIADPKPQQKWCQDCKKAVKAQQSQLDLSHEYNGG